MTPPRRPAWHHFITNEEEFDGLEPRLIIVQENSIRRGSAYKRQLATSSFEGRFAPVTNSFGAIESQT
jgi:hypothetical protein